MERINDLQVLSEEEELALRKERFTKIGRGSVFDLPGERGEKRDFIAVQKEGPTCKAIELTEKNIERIITGRPCEPLELHFDEMDCLNLH